AGPFRNFFHLWRRLAQLVLRHFARAEQSSGTLAARTHMTAIDFLLLLLIAGICGSLAQAVAGYSHGGCLVSIALGFIGALLGSFLARQLKLPEPFMIQVGGSDCPVIWSIVGAALFSAILSLLTRPRPVVMR